MNVGGREEEATLMLKEMDCSHLSAPWLDGGRCIACAGRDG